MDCKTVKQILSLYAGADLDEPQTLMLRQHIASCPKCAKLLESYRANIALLSNLKSEEAPVGTFDNFYAELRARIISSGALAWRRRRRILITAFRAVPVAAAILVALLIWFSAEEWQEYRERALPPPKPDVVTVETVQQITEEVRVPRERQNGVEMEECELLSESPRSSDF